MDSSRLFAGFINFTRKYVKTMGYLKNTMIIDQELMLTKEDLNYVSIEKIKTMITEYNRICDLIIHYQNYEPDRYELERVDWRRHADNMVDSLHLEREDLKKSIWAELDELKSDES